MAAAGWTPKEIADLYGFDRAAVALRLQTPKYAEVRKAPAPSASFRGRAGKIRRMAADGRTPEEIAAHYGCDPAAVAALIGTPVGETWRLQPRKTPTDRQILGRTATRVRELIDQGWDVARIAEALDLDAERIREFGRRLEPDRRERLVIPRTRPEQARLERNRRNAQARARARAKAAADRQAARWVDQWKAAAAEDPRYRDPITPAAPAPPPVEDLDPAPEPPDLVEVREPGPSPAGAKPGMKADDWSQWFVRGEAHGRSRLTEDQVRSIRAQHAAGRSHRELAGMFGVHRQSIFNICTGRTWTHIGDEPAVSADPVPQVAVE